MITASCKESELSYGGKPYSAFTLALIEALSGQGASKLDGFVRAADLAMYAREKVPGRTKGRQHPILHFEEADNFVLAYYSGGETEPKACPSPRSPRSSPSLVPGAESSISGANYTDRRPILRAMSTSQCFPAIQWACGTGRRGGRYAGLDGRATSPLIVSIFQKRKRSPAFPRSQIHPPISQAVKRS